MPTIVTLTRDNSNCRNEICPTYSYVKAAAACMGRQNKRVHVNLFDEAPHFQLPQTNQRQRIRVNKTAISVIANRHSLPLWQIQWYIDTFPLEALQWHLQQKNLHIYFQSNLFSDGNCYRLFLGKGDGEGWYCSRTPLSNPIIFRKVLEATTSTAHDRTVGDRRSGSLITGVSLR